MFTTQTRTIGIFAAMAVLMAATRFNHFGSAVSVPDASCAVFFLGGLYLARSAGAAIAVFAALLLEAGLIDYYATSVQGISDWCLSPAYWFLIPTYGSLWLAGRWAGLRNTDKDRTPDSARLAVLGATAWAACSFAFVLSNVTFYFYSGYFAGMGAAEYATRVAQYYIPYVLAALLYISCAVAVRMAAAIVGRHRAHTH